MTDHADGIHAEKIILGVVVAMPTKPFVTSRIPTLPLHSSSAMTTFFKNVVTTKNPPVLLPHRFPRVGFGFLPSLPPASLVFRVCVALILAAVPSRKGVGASRARREFGISHFDDAAVVFLHEVTDKFFEH